MIALLTDGSFNAGEVEPLEATQIAAAYGITIYTVGAGSRGTALVPVDAGDAGEARYVSSPVTIDEQTLQQIAELTGGRYFRATDAKALRSIYAEIDRLAKAPNVALHQQRYVELSAAEQFVLTVADRGYGKRTSSFEYRTTGRGGKGIVAMSLTQKTGRIVASFPVEESDQIMCVTDQGKLIRTSVSGIRIASRSTQGVIVLDTAEDERVVSVERLLSEEEGE